MSEQAKKMKEAVELLPHAKLAVVEESIYPIHLCQPLKFNRLVLDFLIDENISK